MVSVADVLALPVLQAGEPELASSEGLDNRVRWVHVSEVADLSGFLQGGELVLTTGAALGAAPESYLRGLAKAGAAGVVVELGRHLNQAPAGAGQVARRLGLPLVLLHRMIRFVDVTETVHRAIVAAQYDEVAFARRVHEIFTDLSMHRASLADIVAAAADLLAEPVVLEDLSHRVVAVSAIGTPAATLLDDWDRRSRLASGDAWTMVTVGPRGEEWGRLIIPHVSQLSAHAQLVLERAGQALAISRMAERQQSSIEHQAQSGLVDAVIRGALRDEAEVSARARALGLRSSRSYLPAVMAIRNGPGSTDPVLLQRRNALLVQAVSHAINTARHTGLVTVRGDGEVCMVLTPQSPAQVEFDHTSLVALSGAIRAEVTRVDSAVKPVLGIAAVETAVTSAIFALEDAAHVARAAVLMPSSEKPYYRLVDARLRGLFSLLRGDRRVQQFAEIELNKLIQYDIKTGDTCLDTLAAYLETGGNKTAAARRLHLSRPALYAKLDQIERLLGVDLQDGETRTSLHAAIIALQVNRNGGSSVRPELRPIDLPPNRFHRQ